MVIADLDHQVHQQSSDAQFLVIGYGNEDRGDDGVGPYVAKSIFNWQLPWAKTIAVSELSLDLVASIATSRYVFFVDACHYACAQTVQVAPIEPSGIPTSGTEDGDRPCTPASLLSLAQTLYQRQTQAWAIHIAATLFVPHSRMSALAYHGCDRALSTIERFFVTYGQVPWDTQAFTDPLFAESLVSESLVINPADS
ncbi:MAG: hydrogenase maturation protease [Leptolyngbyaceae cyanobacterium]